MTTSMDVEKIDESISDDELVRTTESQMLSAQRVWAIRLARPEALDGQSSPWLWDKPR